ncbi:PE family protein [Mycobacterium intermedium]|uniref:PE family protein n=1 Tax=Mycobacterium intermedium TaxID=28445 RepID=A0A1E3SPD0_MYCIE|nr:hypothetical protein BHQ20_00615 [Mycobacterium intermedium]OPE52957.1 PE family protein [Mycobacterium intermedium]ORB07708.1 PE family protein [Mycobacterium intermedium]
MVPDIISSAAGNLASIGNAITEANGAAAIPMSGLGVMGADEISAAIKAAFAAHAEQYQAVSARAAAFHAEFVRTLSSGLNAYVTTELANVEQGLAAAVNAPVQSLLGGGPGAAAAAAAEEVTRSFNLPLGPLQLSGSYTATTLTDGSAFASGSAAATLTTPIGQQVLFSASGTGGIDASGPLFASINATTPYGPVGLSLNGTSVTGLGHPAYQITGGSVTLPPSLPLLLAAQYGPAATGTASLMNSTNSFFSALSSGNLISAAQIAVNFPFSYSEAVLFGHTTVSFPDTSLAAALGLPPVVPQVHIPFGGVFADPQPITVTIPTYNFGGATLVGSTFALQGTQFGGVVPLFKNALGLPF